MSSEDVRHNDEGVQLDDEGVRLDDEGVRLDDEGVRLDDERVEDDDLEIRDDDDETLATTTGLRGGDDDVDDEIGEITFYVDDVILWLDSEATQRQVFDAARRFRNFIDERIGGLRTPPEANEE